MYIQCGSVPDSWHPEALAHILRMEPPRDPNATPREVKRLAGRALAGNRIEDVIRGSMTITSSMWLLAWLHRHHMVRLNTSGLMASTGDAAAAPAINSVDGLLDARLATDVLDWDVMAGVLHRRPFQPNAKYFQSFDTLASLQRRIAIMDYHHDLAGRTVLQLGDDEMFSIAVALTGEPRHVHVADVDGTVLAAIAAEAERLALPITTYRVNILRQHIPVTGIDTFFVSNLKDSGGLFLCVASAVATTVTESATGYVSFDRDVFRAGQSDGQVFAEVARMFNRLACTITAMVPCEDLLLSDAQAASLWKLVVALAQRNGTPQEAATWLWANARSAPAPLSLRIGYPDVPLRSAILARIETGSGSRRQGQRLMGLLRRSARPGAPSQPNQPPQEYQ